MTPFTEKTINVLKQIPAGKVMTYGQVAALAGNPRGARQVVRILHSMSKNHHLPWHRVINAKGEIGLTDEEGRFTQREKLMAEGVETNAQGKVDLTIYRYCPVRFEEENEDQLY
ncbi:MAG: MGMT family protein [Carnobacterium sp.]|uniref:MGMT family protein n=1 Tax=Carnobacterium sp. TaxID=48221 RepID=UPI002FC8EF0A